MASANTELMIVVLVSKVIRMATAWVSHTVSKHYMQQIYLDKVLVKGDSPPPLTNQLYLALVIEFVIGVIFIGLLVTINSTAKIFKNIPEDAFTYNVFVDLVLYLIFSGIIGSIIAGMMYKKKYFLYKDDGLRAIRAIAELMTSISIALAAIPLNYIVTGLIAQLKS